MGVQNVGVRADSDQWDQPLGGIRGLGRVRLERTHLEAAIGEIRFSAPRSDLPEADADEIRQMLGPQTLPVFERQTQSVVSVTVGPEGASQTVEEQHGWLLATADRSLLYTLLPSAVVVQTSKYERYSASLGERLRNAVRAFASVTGSDRVQRVGLRFINRLSDSSALSPGFWKPHIRSDFAGPLAGTLGGLVISQLQQTQFQLDDTAAARIQSGAFREADTNENYSFLIDIDVFREKSVRYDEQMCADMMRQLNRTALALFANVLSDEYLAELHPVDVLDEGE